MPYSIPTENLFLLLRPKNVVKKLIAVLANDGFLVPALHVVPLDAVLVEVVEDADAGFVATALPLLSVVGLGLLDAPGMGPEAVAALGGARDADTCRGPVPAILNGRLQVSSVTAGEVAFPSTCPDIVNIVLGDETVDPLGLGLAVDGHAVHTESPAIVPGPLPVHLEVWFL